MTTKATGVSTQSWMKGGAPQNPPNRLQRPHTVCIGREIHGNPRYFVTRGTPRYSGEKKGGPPHPRRTGGCTGREGAGAASAKRHWHAHLLTRQVPKGVTQPAQPKRKKQVVATVYTHGGPDARKRFCISLTLSKHVKHVTISVRDQATILGASTRHK